MVTGRHIDLDARMVCLSLRRARRAMTAAEVRAYWAPTFASHQVLDILQRLAAARCVEQIHVPNHEARYLVNDACTPLPEPAGGAAA